MEFNKKLKLVPLLFMSICLTGCSEDPGVTPITNELGQIQTQISSSSCVDSNYESTIKKLKKAGFKNFKITFEGDVILGNQLSSVGAYAFGLSTWSDSYKIWIEKGDKSGVSLGNYWNGKRTVYWGTDWEYNDQGNPQLKA